MTNREIKFRAWDGERMGLFPLLGFGEAVDINEQIKCSKLTLMQYTGLKDKNGKEIYEGDIIRYKDDDRRITESGLYEVAWVDTHAGFGIRGIATHDDLIGVDMDEESEPSNHVVSDVFPKSEIVGNIYENSELLKSNNNH